MSSTAISGYHLLVLVLQCVAMSDTHFFANENLQSSLFSAMLKPSVRALSTRSGPLAAIRPAVKLQNIQNGGERAGKSFDKNFPTIKPDKKPWEVKGMSKDEFFQRKYSNISDEERQKLNEKVARQRRARQQRNDQEHPKSRNQREYPRNRTRAPGMSFGAAFQNPLSEYVYGTHAVLSALTANNRGGFSKLFTSGLKSKADNFGEIKKLCKNYGIKIIDDYDKQQLARLTNNGVHNGVVLETKKLTLPAIKTLLRVDTEGEYSVSLHNDMYNTTNDFPKSLARNRPGQPIGLYLDGITDPQNAGAIIRSAYFLGVDFIVVPEYDTAKLGPVTAKASAGALDLMDIYQAEDPLKFIDGVRQNGWLVVSTDVKPEQGNTKHYDQLANKFIDPSDLSGMLQKAPMLLVMGSEGSGIRTNMKLKSDFLVGLEKGRRVTDGIVDSLNVSVAAALLMSKCLE